MLDARTAIHASKLATFIAQNISNTNININQH